MATFLDFVASQRKTLPIVLTTQDCTGRTYIVTGANTGLGFECAKHLVQLSAKRVILGVRSISKGEAAKAKIEAETGRTGVAEVWHVDLASKESVKDFAEKIQGLDRVDAVIENAAVALLTRTISEGLETSLTVNVVNTMLLAVLILPKLQESAKKFGILPHLVLVGSETAFQARGVLERIDGDILEGLTLASMDNRYPTSKLLLLYAVRQLAFLRPFSETRVIINFLNPGLCKTELSRNAGFLLKTVITIMKFLLGRTAEEGSRTLLHAAVAGKESHGKYLSDCDIKEYWVASWVTDDAGSKMQTRVWDSISKRLNAIQPKCI